MATLTHCAPLGEHSNDTSLSETFVTVEDPKFYDLGHRSQALIDKVILAIPETHKSCIHSETLQLNSNEHIKLQLMAAKIGITSAPILKAVSKDFPLDSCLRLMLEGLQLQQDRLQAVTQHVAKTDRVAEMQTDIRDLLIQIKKMLKIVQGEAAVQPTSSNLVLNVNGEFEAQVAMHLTLVHLQDFGEHVVRSLRNILRTSEEDE